MRKSNHKFHAKRSSGRRVLTYIPGRGLDVVDLVPLTTATVADRAWQFHANYHLQLLLLRAGIRSPQNTTVFA